MKLPGVRACTDESSLALEQTGGIESEGVTHLRSRVVT